MAWNDGEVEAITVDHPCGDSDLDDVMEQQRAGALAAGAGFGPRLAPAAALMTRQPNRHFYRRRDASARLAG